MNTLTNNINTFGIITLFPEIFSALNHGIAGKAIENNLIKIATYDLKKFVKSPFERVDDRPYGGGPGMILRYEPIHNAIIAAKNFLGKQTPVYFVTPKGKTIDQAKIQQLSTKSNIIFLAGRYEGIDQRIIDTYVDEEISVGDYILSGGEFAILNIIDAITRTLPGVLGNCDSHEFESFYNNLLEFPQYTRPKTINEQKVPEILLSGNHQEIELWRLKQSLGITWLRRKDLINSLKLTQLQKKLLDDFISEYHSDSQKSN